MKNHTKDKGNLGVLKAQLDLYEKGFMPFLPLGEHFPFDLAAYKDGAFKRIQVKYRKLKKGYLEIHFESAWSNSSGTHNKPIDKNEIDLYCVYCPDTDKCYYFDPKKFLKSIRLRSEKPKNGQTKFVHLLEDFEKLEI